MASNPPSPPPIPGVSVLVIHEGRVLLVRRGREPNRGIWALPGGRVEAGERPADAAIREVAEETAVQIDGLREIDSVDVAASDTGQRYAITVFSADYRSGSPTAGDDAADARWLALTDIASLPITDGTRRIIETHGKAAHAA